MIACGHCGGRHATVAEVRGCSVEPGAAPLFDEPAAPAPHRRNGDRHGPRRGLGPPGRSRAAGPKPRRPPGPGRAAALGRCPSRRGRRLARRSGEAARRPTPSPACGDRARHRAAPARSGARRRLLAPGSRDRPRGRGRPPSRAQPRGRRARPGRTPRSPRSSAAVAAGATVRIRRSGRHRHARRSGLGRRRSARLVRRDRPRCARRPCRPPADRHVAAARHGPRPTPTSRPTSWPPSIHGGGGARIIAPAGSGKTRVLTERARHLVRDRGVDPSTICMVAFNVRAREEMQERTADLDRSGDPHPQLAGARDPGRPRAVRLARRPPRAAGHRRARGPSSARRSGRRASSGDGRPDGGLARGAHRHPARPALAPRPSSRSSAATSRDFADGGPRVPGPPAAGRRRRLRRADPRRDRGAVHRSRARAAARRACGVLLVDEFQDLTPAHVLLIRLLAGPARRGVRRRRRRPDHLRLRRRLARVAHRLRRSLPRQRRPRPAHQLPLPAGGRRGRGDAAHPQPAPHRQDDRRRPRATAARGRPRDRGRRRPARRHGRAGDRRSSRRACVRPTSRC